MKLGYAGLFFILMAIPGVLFAQTHPVFEDVVLRLQSGWVYEDISVVLSDDGASVVIIRSDGASMTMHVSRVAVILDSQGNDITTQVIPGAVHSERPTAVDFEPVEALEPDSQRLFTVLFGAGLGFGAPMGEAYSDLYSGLLYYGDVRLAISELNYFKFSYRSERLYSESVVIVDDHDYSEEDVHATIDAREYLMSVGFLTRPDNKTSLRSYGELGFGWTNHVVKASHDGHSGRADEHRVMLVGQVGMIYLFKESGLGLDMGINFLWKVFEGYSGEGQGMLLSGHVGLVVPLGG